jgi:hypothetical protein
MSPPRTPLLRPDRYFAERTTTLGRGVAVGLVTIIALLVGIYVLGWIFTVNIDGTVTVDNPAYPGDAFCDGDSPGDISTSGCDEPAEVERDIDRIIWDAFGSVAGQVAVGLVIVGILVAAGLHLGVALADGEGPFGRTLAVAAWGLAPTVAGMAVTLLVLWFTFDPVTVSSRQDPSVFRDVVGQLAAMRRAGQVTGVLAMAWGAVVWRFGLLHEHDLPGTVASMIAGIVAVLLLLIGML